jgi:histidine ammonia-lyase
MSKSSAVLVLDGQPVTLRDLQQISYGQRALALGPNIKDRLLQSRRNLLKHLDNGTPIYGTNTGVGALFTREIPPEKQAELSRNIVVSHACGVGRPLRPVVVRAIMFGAICNLCQGYSGVRPLVVQSLVDFLNADLLPRTPESGSVGSLTHMAHIGNGLLGHGECRLQGQSMSLPEALEKTGLVPLVLEAGEGLSMVSGTPSLIGIGGVATIEALRLVEVADISAALSFEALGANPSSLHSKVHEVRPHAGQGEVARRMRELLEGSELLSRENLQDCLSLRTTPQVHGSTRQTVKRAQEVLQVELNSATDNPLIFEDEVLSACNAHGEPMSQCFDGLTTGLAELGNISERRTDRLLNFRINGLPPFLTPDPGLCSGLMIPQYVAAYLVSENKVLSHPVSVDSIPMSAFQEDHVNMGTLGAVMASRVAENVTRILAIELLTARAALRFREPSQPSPRLRDVVATLDSQVQPVISDRVLGPDIEKMADYLRSGGLLGRF